MLHGHSGSGKSTLEKQIVRSVLTGEDFLGEPVVQGDVLFIQLDEPTDWSMETLINKMRLPKEAASQHLTVVDMLPDRKRGVESLEMEVEENPDIRLVVIDTLQSFANAEELNGNSEMGFAMGDCRVLLRKYPHTSMLIVHHSNKQGGLLGAQVIKGSSDLVFRIAMDETKPNTNYLTNDKWRTIPRQPDRRLKWNPETHLYTVEGIFSGGEGYSKTAAKALNARLKKQEQILELLADNPQGFKKTALHSKVKGNWEVFEEALAKLAEQYLITIGDDKVVKQIKQPNPKEEPAQF